MRTLINISNHNSTNWTENQKSGFNQIIDIAFPNISPTATSDDVESIAWEIFDGIMNIINTNNLRLNEFSICCQGEFTLTNMVSQLCMNRAFQMVVPTTERVSVEKDGVKSSVFNFVQWRTITNIVPSGF